MPSAPSPRRSRRIAGSTAPYATRSASSKAVPPKRTTYRPSMGTSNNPIVLDLSPPKAKPAASSSSRAPKPRISTATAARNKTRTPARADAKAGSKAIAPSTQVQLVLERPEHTEDTPSPDLKTEDATDPISLPSSKPGQIARATRQFSREVDDLQARQIKISEEEARLKGLDETIRNRKKALKKREEQIERLEQGAYKKSAQQMWDAMEQDITCGICMELMVAPQTFHQTRCGHVFCGPCILKIIFGSTCNGCNDWHGEPQVSCPMCNASTTLNPNAARRGNPLVPNRALASLISAFLEQMEGKGRDSQQEELGKWKTRDLVAKELMTGFNEAWDMQNKVAMGLVKKMLAQV
ncbi:hypothetical protein BOTBODRAFT_171972 [Botryobasidium botryosum FD-172 SS1]|uniref:RING-type domain-containing protein n=1 Tax=Botryobasidium botryosum (strain FD-172 SS1) TaxID=930990 RepID=A0A067N138_BOTB1|nr:hypothetical protein BOTBODRAFT_171972 [Botryobasidium botryosum FD-172 SS1]